MKLKKNHMITATSRRSLLKNIAIGIALIPALELGAERAFAADAPFVTADDSTAKALKYVDNAKNASAAKPGSHCGDCMFYHGATGSTHGPCAIFPGKQVKAAGWCSSWTVKA